MSKEMREQINKVKNFGQFLNESKTGWYDIDEKLKLLKSYIHILDNDKGLVSGKKYDIPITYFIILHNFLIIERGFFDDIKLNDKEINKYLKLEKLNTPDEVYEKFLELYDTSNKVRVNSETLDSIESVRLYLSKRPEVYSRLIKK